ncbi:UNVERIFIED_CONTAM: hypothetical protein GTU68_036358 [Idotea baltica]|nr:hypothetical protein [Idotea baltica]
MDRSNPDEEEEGHCLRLMAILRSFLLSQGHSPKSTDDLHSNTVNLLLVIPPKLYQELVQPMPKDHIAEYDGKDMSAVVRLLEFLHRRLKNNEVLSPILTPILTLMVEMTQSVRVIRKFVRLKVLPPLRDVMRRPEEGEGVRNKLCLLMTSPLPDLKYLSANLLFILCKESVDRLIKYTGYGNAAGLLASRGLMLNRKRGSEESYSSESEDSDTEEYEKIKDKVNPVTGRYEPPRPSPLEGMTEEQKEYEAMKLVNALDKLSR